MLTVPISTLGGIFTACFSDRGLARLDFPGRASVCLPSRSHDAPKSPRWQRLTEAALKLALAGRRPRPLPPLDLAAGTPFQRAVWNALRRIPSGQTRSYAEIAKAIRRPKAVRAVGQACGANPIAILIPCHRVRAAGGGLGGFSAGLAWKRRLLEREGALPSNALLKRRTAP